MDDIRRVLRDLTVRYGGGVASYAFATGPVINAYTFFGELAEWRPDLRHEARLWNAAYEPIPYTRITRSTALGGDLVLRTYAIERQTGILKMDYYRDSTGTGEAALYSGKGRHRTPTPLWRPLKLLEREVGPYGEYGAYRDGGHWRLPHILGASPSSSGFPDEEFWPETRERWEAAVRRLALK